MVRIPPALPLLPDRSESFVLREPFANIFEGIADGANYLAGFLFLRVTSIVVAPYVPARNSNTPVSALNTRCVRLTTSALGRYLFVALGYSAVRADAYVTATTRAAHNSNPGTGAIRDPGCSWYRSNGDLPNPVEDRVWQPLGLKWTHTGLREPPSVVAGDPIATRPRMLHISPNTATDVVLKWDDIKLNSILLCEAWKPNA